MRSLTAAEAQQTFRACLDALARPGRIVELDRCALPDRVPASYLPMLALTDLMTPIAALDDDPLVAELSIVTGAPLSPIADARWVVSSTTPDEQRLSDLSRGTSLDPERGAVLCQTVQALRAHASDTVGDHTLLELEGPGIEVTRSLSVHGLGAEFFRARADLVDYPQGIDVLLVSDTSIVGIPRTTHIRATQVRIAERSEVAAQ